jgi:hypothetical protein
MAIDAAFRLLALWLLAAGVAAGCARPEHGAEQPVAAVRSPHGAVRLACGRCHDAGAWTPTRRPMSFVHDRETGFILTGRHAAVSCSGCHLRLRFDEPRVTQGECAACHVDVHAGRLGAACGACHGTDQFAGAASRDAHAATSFPLAGMHRQVPCEACHVAANGERFTPLPTECAACHAADYAAAVPDHAAAGFPPTCGRCHGVVSWAHARFDHAGVTGYPLEGAHRRAGCQACHAPPDFALRFLPAGPRDCITCHQPDYQRAHPDFGFATDCLGCHSQDSFGGARFADHEARFPIYSGPHAGRWATCTQCHTAGVAGVSCLGCHEHSQARMDDKHRSMAGYLYETATCLSCHPRGRKE